jgi:Ca2+-binding RTX toxin-like protein
MVPRFVGATLAVLLLPFSPSYAAVVVTDATAFVVSIDADDDVTIDCSAGSVRVFDDGAPTVYTTACSAVTSLTVNGGPGANAIDLSGVTAAAFTGFPPVSISGGADVDAVTGSGLDDTILGGAGADPVQGGGGDDSFTWNPGDGSDTFDGGSGVDTHVFNGSAGAELFTVTAEGTGFDLFRNLGNILMDIDGTERLELNALAGDDTVTTAALTSVAQFLNGGAHTASDTLGIDFGASCFLPENGVFHGPDFEPIEFTEFEVFQIEGAECPSAPEIPTLGPWGLGLLFGGLLAVGAAMLRRRAAP